MMLKSIRQIATPEFWINFRQKLIQNDVPQALFSIGITTVFFFLGSIFLQWLYTSKIATQPLITISSIVFTSAIVTLIAFLVMKLSFKVHIALSEKLDKVIEFMLRNKKYRFMYQKSQLQIHASKMLR